MRHNETVTSVTKTTRFSLLFVSILCASLFFVAPDAFARTSTKKSSGNPRYAAVIMDAQTGKILHQSSPHKPLAPASLTKMMTLFMTFEALESGKIHLNKYLTISQNAINQPPSKLGMKRTTKITVKDAIYILVTRSANDVAYALAETVGGSHDAFTKSMTRRAHALGMKNSYFYNASGLPHPQQKSSAYDMAILGRSIMQYFPQYYHFFKTIRYNYNGQVIETHNNLMRRFEGMDGMKTGYTHASGFNLVSSAVRNNRRVIVAVFGGRTAMSRDNHVADLMNRGFAAMDAGKATTQYASTMPSKPASRAVAVTKAAPAPKAAPITATTQKRDTHVATVSQTTSTRTQSGQWVPDGGAVRPLTAPQQAASHYNAPQPPVSAYQTASYQQEHSATRNWGIQVGAFSSAALGQRALQNVQQQLKPVLQDGAQPMIVPLQTSQGTVYRARIIGLSPQSASQACQQLTDCMAFVQR